MDRDGMVGLDPDQILGRFELLPWPIFPNFDIVTISDWATTNSEPLYVPGWLGFMRYSDKTRALALRYPGFASAADIVHLLAGDHGHLIDEGAVRSSYD